MESRVVPRLFGSIAPVFAWPFTRPRHAGAGLGFARLYAGRLVAKAHPVLGKHKRVDGVFRCQDVPALADRLEGKA